MIWMIFEPGGESRGLPPLRIRAKCFDDALARARYIDPRYCGGCVVDDERDGEGDATDV